MLFAHISHFASWLAMVAWTRDAISGGSLEAISEVTAYSMPGIRESFWSIFASRSMIYDSRGWRRPGRIREV